MKLGSDEDGDSDYDDVPRYIPVHDISAFPEEEELLFSGNQNKFELVDICDCSTSKWHTSQLSAFRKFQKMLESGNPVWNEKEISMIQEYKELIASEYVIFLKDVSVN